MVKGVITGDLVNSTNIAAKWRQTVVDALHVCVEESIPQTPIKLEMYRGDSFQVVVDKPEYVLAIAIALRAKLKAETPDGQKLWDARLAVGVGEIFFESDNIVTSDGEASRLSGHFRGFLFRWTGAWIHTLCVHLSPTIDTAFACPRQHTHLRSIITQSKQAHTLLHSASERLVRLL